jgi:hypothetical protein
VNAKGEFVAQSIDDLYSSRIDVREKALTERGTKIPRAAWNDVLTSTPTNLYIDPASGRPVTTLETTTTPTSSNMRGVYNNYYYCLAPQ